MTDDEFEQRLAAAQESGALSLEDATDNHLKTVSKLSNLVVLDLAHGPQITDAGLAHLRTLASLKSLALSSCDQITDAGVKHLRELDSLQTLRLLDCHQITDAGLQHLRYFSTLQALSLAACRQLSDAGITHLRALRSLHTLNLSYCEQVTDAGLAHLRALRALQTLQLRACHQITGAGLEHLRELSSLQVISLAKCKQLSDTGLAHIRGFKQLKALNLSYCEQVTNAGLAHLRGLRNLQTLNLYHCNQLTGGGLRHLRTLSSLETLNLSWCVHVTDAGLKHVGGLSSLQTLHLAACWRITDKGIEELQSLRSLQTLRLSICSQITDAGLEHLKANRSLNNIDLYGCKLVTDAGLAHLRGLRALKTLTVSCCEQVTDAGLAHLRGLSSLQTLDASFCERITDLGISHLASALIHLETIYLSECSINSVAPEQLASGDAQAIFAAFRSGRSLNRIRVAIVGMGGVGKTWLFRPLFMRQPWAADETERQETHDVSLVRPEQIEWRPTLRTADEPKPLITHVWDFGGQLVLHGVHEEFLRPDGRTVYLLVLSADRKPQRDPDRNRQESGNGLDYWLNTISAFAGSAPVCVTVTQCDRHGPDAPRPIDKPVAADMPRLADFDVEMLAGYKKHRANVVALVPDCTAKYPADAVPEHEGGEPTPGIARLRTAIEEAAQDLPALGGKFPESTLQLLDRVEAAWRERATVSLCEFQEWQREVGGRPEGSDLDVLRDLGVLFYFSETPLELSRREGPHDGVVDLVAGEQERRRRRTAPSSLSGVLFNPHWVKWPLYEVTRRSEGAPWFTLEQLRAALQSGIEASRTDMPDLEPPANANDLLIDVLDHTGLCFEERGDGPRRWFFPRGCPARPDFLPEWVNAPVGAREARVLRWPLLRESALHRYAVELLHEGAIPDTARGGPSVWRSCLRVRHAGEPCEAWLEADFDESTLTIDAHGGKRAGRQALLNEVTRHLRRLAGPTSEERDEVIAASVPSAGRPQVESQPSAVPDVCSKAVLRLIDHHKIVEDRAPNEADSPTVPLSNKDLAGQLGVDPARVTEALWNRTKPRGNKYWKRTSTNATGARLYQRMWREDPDWVARTLNEMFNQLVVPEGSANERATNLDMGDFSDDDRPTRE
ncbi:MAG: hypothetical protein AAFV43_03470 [Planctomycetota bacterium]